MPNIDLNSQPNEFLEKDYDFIIIGAGAAGILLSLKLAERKKKVLVFESGHFMEDKDRQILNKVEQTGKIIERVVEGRKRAIGGTTIAWGGQSLPFCEIDFEDRAWVENSSWPITYEEIRLFYPLANGFMQIDDLDYEEDIFRILGMQKLDIDESLLCYHFSKWAPDPNFRKLYLKRLEKEVTIVYNAVLKSIHLNESGEADHISVGDFNNNEYSLKSTCLIIACGGIETNRILLNCNDQVRGGIGNHSGWLGKCFMEHPCVEVGEVHAIDNYRLQSCFNSRMKGGKKYSLRLSLAEQFQKEAELLNGSAYMEFSYENEGLDPYLEIKKYMINGGFFPVFNAFKNSKALWKSGWALYRDNLHYKHGAASRLKIITEQEPTRNSAITLGDERDQFGMRKANINWQISEKTWKTVIHLSRLVKSELSRLSLADLKLYNWINENEHDWKTFLRDSNHHMGGTRMSKKPDSGVVNSDLQVWGHDNVFLCSSSVFPTSSHSNPTLTLLALTIRLSEFLVKKYNH